MDAGKYVVLDVETNGFSSLKHDLLSISIYKPDEDKIYERFLPLELNDKVYTTKINGITKKKLRNAKPLTQIEVDALIVDFDLNNRTILTYGGIDEKFIRNYFRRKHIEGYSRLTFYNFKKDIISSKFSGGNVTKDNLCNLFNIKNVQSVHSGKSDCILEWKLFEKLNGDKLLITEDKVFLMNDSYIIPASFFHTHSNIKYCISKLPYIHVEKEEIKRFSIYGKNIKKFPMNFNGLVIENLINSMLFVKKKDPRPFCLENKKKLKYIGKLPPAYEYVPLFFNSDGTVTATRKIDKKLEKELNIFVQDLRDEMSLMIDFIAKVIFNGKNIFSQELMVYPDDKVLAICDLSSSDAVMEIKTGTCGIKYIDSIRYQLYYEAKGRNCYILQTDWNREDVGLTFIISKIIFSFEKPKKEVVVKKQISKKCTRICKPFSYEKVDRRKQRKFKIVKNKTESSSLDANKNPNEKKVYKYLDGLNVCGEYISFTTIKSVDDKNIYTNSEKISYTEPNFEENNMLPGINVKDINTEIIGTSADRNSGAESKFEEAHMLSGVYVDDNNAGIIYTNVDKASSAKSKFEEIYMSSDIYIDDNNAGAYCVDRNTDANIITDSKTETDLMSSKIDDVRRNYSQNGNISGNTAFECDK